MSAISHGLQIKRKPAHEDLKKMISESSQTFASSDSYQRTVPYNNFPNICIRVPTIVIAEIIELEFLAPQQAPIPHRRRESASNQGQSDTHRTHGKQPMLQSEGDITFPDFDGTMMQIGSGLSKAHIAPLRIIPRRPLNDDKGSIQRSKKAVSIRGTTSKAIGAEVVEIETCNHAENTPNIAASSILPATPNSQKPAHSPLRCRSGASQDQPRSYRSPDTTDVDCRYSVQSELYHYLTHDLNHPSSPSTSAWTGSAIVKEDELCITSPYQQGLPVTAFQHNGQSSQHDYRNSTSSLYSSIFDLTLPARTKSTPATPLGSSTPSINQSSLHFSALHHTPSPARPLVLNKHLQSLSLHETISYLTQRNFSPTCIAEHLWSRGYRLADRRWLQERIVKDIIASLEQRLEHVAGGYGETSSHHSGTTSDDEEAAKAEVESVLHCTAVVRRGVRELQACEQWKRMGVVLD